MTLTLTAGQASLWRATQLIEQAGRAAETASSDLNTIPVRCREFDVKSLLWQALVLLPDDLPLDGPTPENAGCTALLAEAEAELRTFPLEDYPDGITELVVDLCDLIASSRAQGLA